MVTPSQFVLCCLLFIAVMLTGCASLEERHSFDEWIRIKHSTHPHALDANPQSSDAEPAFDPETTLDSYLDYAARNNPSLEATFNRWKAALERIPQVRSLPDPRFTYRYFIENVETRAGPQKQGFGLSLKQE